MEYRRGFFCFFQSGGGNGRSPFDRNAGDGDGFLSIRQRDAGNDLLLYAGHSRTRTRNDQRARPRNCLP